jgi:3-dehydroquinate synthetase
MMLAFELSEEMGLCPPGEASRAAAHLQAVGLPVRIADIAAATGGELPTAQELIALMAQDKKAKAGRLAFILARRIGETFVTDAVELDQLARFLEARCRNAG